MTCQGVVANRGSLACTMCFRAKARAEVDLKNEKLVLVSVHNLQVSNIGVSGGWGGAKQPSPSPWDPAPNAKQERQRLEDKCPGLNCVHDR